jgi:uncharacterized protein
MTAYVASDSFPCVGARSAFNKGRVRFGSYARFGADTDVEAICDDLERFAAEFPDPGSDPVTFCAMFDDDVATESDFAKRMWATLQAMHERDQAAFSWDPTVSPDPSEPDFSFSIGGRAFFVVGLHPAASRMARRSPVPCLVFNFHNQFETLRGNGKYEGMQKVIRRREMELQGSINPVLARFGDQSEARQYSGVAVEAGWQCPFHQIAETHDA